ncbi:hypothetical protein HZ994_06610 [Akkermansiaceae bacterium]|nr:hypothetical protein HZ994_06610 [Akkermansiaceae bacterium]
MKLTVSAILVCLLILVAAYFANRENTASGSPAPHDVTKTKGSPRNPSERAARNQYAEKNWNLGEPTTASERAYEDATTAGEKQTVLAKLEASDPGSLANVLRRALLNPDEGLRIHAVMMTPSIYQFPEDATDILAAASCDDSAEVRSHALQMLNEQPSETKLKVYATTLGSPLAEVREMTVLELGRMKSKPALELLFQGLGYGDPDFSMKVNDELSTLINARFDSLDEANGWWKANSVKFDERLMRIED